jgi:histidinol-phosphate aminotransferase
VCADINDVAVKEIPLTPSYQINVEAVLAAIDKHTKVIWICSPNNPTGNTIYTKDIVQLLTNFNGLVVIDEAYIDFAPDKSFTQKIKDYPNLIILQTFSKAWGMAALRLGMAFASTEIIGIFNKVKYPYNINQVTQEMALEALHNLLNKEMMVEEILTQRAWLEEELGKLNLVIKIHPSDANFLLVKMHHGHEVYEKLVAKKIITRDRSMVTLCEDCVRITVGTASENQALIKALRQI